MDCRKQLPLSARKQLPLRARAGTGEEAGALKSGGWGVCVWHA